MSALTISIAAGLVVALILGASSRVRALVALRIQYGHLRALANVQGPINIVVPSFPLERFTIDGVPGTVAIPPNVTVMPLAEGEAIGELLRTLTRLFPQREVNLQPHASYSVGPGLTIAVGGPSVNVVSRRALDKWFPEFRLRYPEHVATLGSVTYNPDRASDDSLTEDYGFVAVGPSDGACRVVVLCGVWAPGTLAATRCLLGLRARSDAAKSVGSAERTLLVSRASIDELASSAPELQSIVR